jgi:hypothetical protein
LRKFKVALFSEKQNTRQELRERCINACSYFCFDGSKMLAVLTFLRQLKVEFDDSGITQAMTPRFTIEFVRKMVPWMPKSSRAFTDLTINSNHFQYQHLHKDFVTESAMMRS